MKSISIILLAVWLILFGAVYGKLFGLTMDPHGFGIVTSIVGIVILVVEFWVWHTNPNR